MSLRFFAQLVGHLGKFRRIPAVGLDQVSMGDQHQVARLLTREQLRATPQVRVRQFLKFSTRRLEIGPLRSGGGDMEQPVQPKRLEQVAVVAVGIDDLDTAGRVLLAQRQSNPGQHPEKCTVHAGALVQIEHELPVPALDHLDRKAAQRSAVLKRPAPDHTDFDRLLGAEDEYAGLSLNHGTFSFVRFPTFFDALREAP